MASSRHAGITERRDRDGRTRYRVTVRRQGFTGSATFPTLSEALSWRAKALDASDGRSEAPAAPERPTRRREPARAVTVDDASRRLCRALRNGSVRTRDGRTYKPSVVREYEASLRLLVLPRIGGLPLASLTRGDVQRLVDELAADHTPSHARKALTALRVVVRTTERWGDVPANACHGVRAPATSVTPRPARVLTRDEAHRLLDAAAADDTRLGRSFTRPLVGLLLGTGLRHGEALALAWGEGVDLDTGVVRVVRSLDRHHGDDGYRFVPPKSRSSRRSVPLPPAELAQLRRHRLATGRPADGQLVFRGDDGPVAPHGLPRAAWRRLVHGTDQTAPLAKLDAPLPCLHDLRHTFASFALAAGLGFHAVAELLGHGDATLVASRYGHALRDELASAGERLAAFLEGGRTLSESHRQ